MKKQKLFVRIVCIVLVVLMAVSVGAVAITAFSANAAQSTEEVSASVSAGASGYINASYVNLRSGAGTNYSVITCMAKNTKFTFVDGKLYNSSLRYLMLPPSVRFLSQHGCCQFRQMNLPFSVFMFRGHF